MASRSLDDLTHAMRDMCVVHKQLCKVKGVDLLVYCTLRSNEEQAELYKIGRTPPGRIVTNARPGQSAHNPDSNGRASAYDCVPLFGGKPIWDGRDPLWQIVITAGEEAGLLASARWQGKMKEQAHFQSPTWRKPG